MVYSLYTIDFQTGVNGRTTVRTKCRYIMVEISVGVHTRVFKRVQTQALIIVKIIKAVHFMPLLHLTPTWSIAIFLEQSIDPRI